MNLNGNEFLDFEHTITALLTIPSLRSLFINLHEEDQVDMVMRTLPTLEELNGLPVERELINISGESQEENDIPQRIEEDEMEDEETFNSSKIVEEPVAGADDQIQRNENENEIEIENVNLSDKDEDVLEGLDEVKER